MPLDGYQRYHHCSPKPAAISPTFYAADPTSPALDEQIVQTVVDDYTRPAGRRMMTADLRALYPRDTEDQAVLRPLTRKRTGSPPYERASLAAGALTARVHAVRRADRLGSRVRPHTVGVPAALGSRLRPSRPDRKARRGQEPTTDVATREQNRRAFEAAAKVAAKLQDGIRERAVAHGPRPQPAPAPTTPPHAQQPGAQHTPGRTTGGVA